MTANTQILTCKQFISSNYSFKVNPLRTTGRLVKKKTVLCFKPIGDIVRKIVIFVGEVNQNLFTYYKITHFM